MTLEQIKDNAPKGATHYCNKTGQYYKYDYFNWYVFVYFEWKWIKNVSRLNLKPL